MKSFHPSLAGAARAGPATCASTSGACAGRGPVGINCAPANIGIGKHTNWLCQWLVRQRCRHAEDALSMHAVLTQFKQRFKGLLSRA